MTIALYRTDKFFIRKSNLYCIHRKMLRFWKIFTKEIFQVVSRLTKQSCTNLFPHTRFKFMTFHQPTAHAEMSAFPNPISIPYTHWHKSTCCSYGFVEAFPRSYLIIGLGDAKRQIGCLLHVKCSKCNFHRFPFAISIKRRTFPSTPDGVSFKRGWMGGEQNI